MTDQPMEKYAETQAIVARLICTGMLIDIKLPATLDAQKNWALAKYDEHLKSGLQFGYALNVIKEQMEHGEFIGWLSTNNIKTRAAQNYMKTAKFIAGMDQISNSSANANTQRVAHLENPNLDPDIETEQEIDAILARVIDLPLRKQIELTKHSPESIRRYFEDGLFDEIDRMNPTQIRTVIRQQKQLESMTARNQRDAERIQELHDENRRLKATPEERRIMQTMREQLFADMETAQAIITRARKTFEYAKNFEQDVETEAREAVIHPLLHMLCVLHGGAKLIADDCYVRWSIDPSIPINPPLPNTLTHEEKWLAEESARYQAAVTAEYLPKKRK